jgi:hypothetical protein
VPEIPANASDREIVEFCIQYLEVRGLITTQTDAHGNIMITINDNALNHPDMSVRRFVKAIRGWAVNPLGGTKAINFLENNRLCIRIKQSQHPQARTRRNQSKERRL